MTYTPHPLHLADKAQQMARYAKGSNAEAFQKVATISMCIVAVTVGMQMLMNLYREINRDNSRSR